MRRNEMTVDCNKLETRPLGRTGLRVTVAGLGAAGLGNFFRTMSNAEAQALLAETWNAGIRYFDTSPFYGRGRSERRLGTFLDDVERSSFVLSTKVGRLLEPAPKAVEEDGIFVNPAPFNSRYDYSYDGVMRSYEASRQRIGMGNIDILLVHDIGVMLHQENAENQLCALKGGGLRALEELRDGGEIRGYGLGVNEVAACLDCLDYGDPDVFLLAGRFTLLEHKQAMPLFDVCRGREIAVVAGGIYNSGILATGAVAGSRYNYAAATPEILARVKRIEQVCKRHAVPLSTAALRFVLAHPAVVTVLLGVGSTRSLRSNISAIHAGVPDALWVELRDRGIIDAGLDLP